MQLYGDAFDKLGVRLNKYLVLNRLNKYALSYQPI